MSLKTRIRKARSGKADYSPAGPERPTKLSKGHPLWVPHLGRTQGPPLRYKMAPVEMRNDSEIHHRRSIRKRGYDYSFPGWYFFTVCTDGKYHAFGAVVDWELHLNDAGRMVAEMWKRTPERFPEVVLDEFVVMPNHFHAIFQLVGAPLVGALPGAGTRPAPTVGDIVGAFKSLTANQNLRAVEEFSWHRMPKKLWQRNYFERILRNQRELEATRAYIRENPARWDTDPENET
jgi:REP-associated tyrosine transposase